LLVVPPVVPEGFDVVFVVFFAVVVAPAVVGVVASSDVVLDVVVWRVGRCDVDFLSDPHATSNVSAVIAVTTRFTA
jgi:hypothetical protein